MLSTINLKLIAAGLGVLGLALAVWWLTGSYKDAVWGARLADQQKTVTEAHNAALQDALDKERIARTQADELEVKYHDQTQAINLLAADNRRLADELDGLRDPYAAAATCGNQGTAPGCPPCPAATGKLSKEASKFLLELTEEADRMSAYAWTCWGWINRDRPGAMEPPEGAILGDK